MPRLRWLYLDVIVIKGLAESLVLGGVERDVAVVLRLLLLRLRQSLKLLQLLLSRSANLLQARGVARLELRIAQDARPNLHAKALVSERGDP